MRLIVFKIGAFRFVLALVRKVLYLYNLLKVAGVYN